MRTFVPTCPEHPAHLNRMGRAACTYPPLEGAGVHFNPVRLRRRQPNVRELVVDAECWSSAIESVSAQTPGESEAIWAKCTRTPLPRSQNPLTSLVQFVVQSGQRKGLLTRYPVL